MERVVKILQTLKFGNVYFCKHCANVDIEYVTKPCPECGSGDIIIATGRRIEVRTESNKLEWAIQFHHESDERIQGAYNMRKGIEVPFLSKDGDGLFYSVTVNKNHVLAKMSTYKTIEQINKERGAGVSGTLDNMIQEYEIEPDNKLLHDLKRSIYARYPVAKEKTPAINEDAERPLNFFQKLFAMFRQEQ